MGAGTMALAALALAGAAAGMGALQSLQAGKDAKAWSEYNAAVLEREAEMARQNAALEAEQQRKAGERMKGAQRAAFAKAGVDVGSGSPLDVLAETAAETELAVSTIKWAGEQQARRAISAAEASRMKGDAAKRASYWGAGTTLLSGASRMASQGANYYNRYGGGNTRKKSSIVEEDIFY